MTEAAAAAPAANNDAGAAAAALAAGGAAPAAGAADSQSAAGGSWLASLPAELQADPTLTRYNSIDELARGHIEAHKTAKSKAVPLPGDTEESRKAFADALRPANVEAYDFGEVPATMDGDLVNGFRQFAFDSGFPPHMAKATMDFYGTMIGKQVEAANAASQKEVDQFQKDYGSGYSEKLEQVKTMLEGFTGTPLELSDADMNRMDIKLGSSGLMQFMFALHDRVGDPAYAGEGAVGNGLQSIAPENAEKVWKERMANAEWRAKAKVAGSAEAQEADRLQKLISQHRMKLQAGG